jgi:hypothetical protein
MIDTLQIDVKGLKDFITALAKDAVKEILSTPDEQRKRFITRSETAELLNVSLVTLHGWDKAGTLSPCRMGGRIYYDITEIHELINNRDNKRVNKLTGV